MWHYVQNGQARGPVEASALQPLLQSGAITPDSLVWQQGMRDWVPLRTIAELAPFITPPGGPPPIPSLRGPNASSTADADKADIESNRAFAMMAYLLFLFLVPLLAAPNSKFARYHTNQGIILFLALCLAGLGSLALLPIPFVHLILIPIWMVLPAATFVFIVIGIVHAASGEYKPLPWIGHFRLLN